MKKIIMKTKASTSILMPNGTTKATVYVALNDIPIDDLIDWTNGVNPRGQNPQGQQVKSIITGLKEDPINFLHRNLGVNIVAKNIEIAEDSVTLYFTDSSKEGTVNGGHTLNALKQFKSMYPEFCDEITVMFNLSFGEELYVSSNTIVSVATGLNTCEKVVKRDIRNLAGNYEPLKELLSQEPYFKRILFKSFSGSDKKLTVGNIISLMYCFDQQYYGQNEFGLYDNEPTDGYNSKAHVENRYDTYLNKYGWEKENPYMQMKYILTEMVRVYDYINVNLPYWYNTNQGKKYGALVDKQGGRPNAQRKPSTSLYFKNTCTGYVAQAPVIIIFASLRALVKIKDGFYTFCTDPIIFLNKEGPKLAKQTLESVSGYGNYTAAAKDSGVWAKTAMLAANLAKKYI